MKRIFLAAFITVFGIITFSAPAPAMAGPFSYTALETIPGSDSTGEISPYLQAIYRFALWAVGIAALFMLSVGGMMYLTSAGNTSQISTAKTVIFDALIGLVLAILAWLVLYVINPQLIEVNLDIFQTVSHATGDTSQVGGSVSNNGAAVGTNPAPNDTVKTLAQKLLSSAVGSGDCASASGTVSPKGNLQEVIGGNAMTTCHNGCNTSSSLCNRTSNISQTLLQGLADMSEETSFTINSLASGSHATTSMHYSGNAADIDKPSSGVQSYVTSHGTQTCSKVYKVTSTSGAVLYFYDEDSSHWHVQTSLGSLCG